MQEDIYYNNFPVRKWQKSLIFSKLISDSLKEFAFSFLLIECNNAVFKCLKSLFCFTVICGECLQFVKQLIGTSSGKYSSFEHPITLLLSSSPVQDYRSPINLLKGGSSRAQSIIISFFLCIYSLVSFIQNHGLKDHPYADNSAQIYMVACQLFLRLCKNTQLTP